MEQRQLFFHMVHQMLGGLNYLRESLDNKKGSPFISINYYAPNDENGQIQVLNEIQEQLDLLDPDQDTQIIWGGDFNVIFDTNLDADGATLN